jgi:hypothetical protein
LFMIDANLAEESPLKTLPIGLKIPENDGTCSPQTSQSFQTSKDDKDRGDDGDGWNPAWQIQTERSRSWRTIRLVGISSRGWLRGAGCGISRWSAGTPGD